MRLKLSLEPSSSLNPLIFSVLLQEQSSPFSQKVLKVLEFEVDKDRKQAPQTTISTDSSASNSSP
jgi:hypothetical protein